MLKISFSLILTLISFHSYCQGHLEIKPKWPSFTCKAITAANMYWGLKKSNHENANILRTPPSIGPEVGLLAGLRINQYGSVYTGVSYTAIPIHISYNFIGDNMYAAPEYTDWRLRSYFLGLTVFSIPLTFEYTIPIKNSKNHILLEAGIIANYNSTNSYQYEVYETINDQPIFEFQIQDNNGLSWYPSGLFKIGYLKSFKQNGGFSASLGLGFSGATLGIGSYKFNGFEYNHKGNVSLTPNMLSFSLAYHFRHTRVKPEPRR